MTTTRFWMLAMVGLLVWAGPAFADKIYLTNGDVVTGEILELDGDDIVFDIELIDEVKIGIGDIKYLETSRPFSIQFDDGRELHGYVVVEDGKMVLRPELPKKPEADADAADAAAEAAEVADAPTEPAEEVAEAAEAVEDEAAAATDAAKAVAEAEVDEKVEADAAEVAEAAEAVAEDEDGLFHHAPPTLADGQVITLDDMFKFEAVETYYRYEAEIDVGIDVASGNTDQQNFNLSGAFRPSFGKNTIGFSGQLNRSVSDGDTTASNWRVQAQYEREFTPRWRLIGLNRYEQDTFQDLDLRVTAAVGPGYSIWLDNPYLDIYLAPAYVHESFEDEERDFAAVVWGLDYEYELGRPDVDFYHEHTLTVGVTESQNVALTKTGVSWELIGDLDLKLEYQLNWNSDPTDDNEQLDHRYLIKISYEFEGNENDWFK